MQALKSLFHRAQSPRAAAVPQGPAGQPTELSADSLKLVGGGLPRIGGSTAVVAPEPVAASTLPSVG